MLIFGIIKHKNTLTMEYLINRHLKTIAAITQREFRITQDFEMLAEQWQIIAQIIERGYYFYTDYKQLAYQESRENAIAHKIEKVNNLQIDHKISVKTGFRNGISIEDISHVSNLRTVSAKENLFKRAKNVIDKKNRWILKKYGIKAGSLVKAAKYIAPSMRDIDKSVDNPQK